MECLNLGGNISACFASAIFNIHSLPKAARVYFPGTKMPVTLMAHSHGKANKPCGGTSQPLFSIQFGGKKTEKQTILYKITKNSGIALNPSYPPPNTTTTISHHQLPIGHLISREKASYTDICNILSLQFFTKYCVCHCQCCCVYALCRSNNGLLKPNKGWHERNQLACII